MQILKATITLALVSACAAPAKMVNTSPVTRVPAVPAIETIPASLLVRTQEPGEPLSDDVANALRDVFQKVSSERSGTLGGDFELMLSFESDSDHHMAAGIGKAVLSGLTFGIASSAQVDAFDYKVTIRATLTRDARTIATYEAVGAFRSEVSETASLEQKQQRVREAVEKSFAHALSLLKAQITQDHSRIIASL